MDQSEGGGEDQQMKDAEEKKKRTIKTEKRKYFDVVELSKKINRTQNPGLLEDVRGIFTHLLPGPLISHKFRLPAFGQLAEVFDRHNYTKRLFLFNHRENGFDVFFKEGDSNDRRGWNHEEDDFYVVGVREGSISFFGRHGEVVTKRRTKEVKLMSGPNGGQTKRMLDPVPKLVYKKTDDGMKQLLEDVETTLDQENGWLS